MAWKFGLTLALLVATFLANFASVLASAALTRWDAPAGGRLVWLEITFFWSIFAAGLVVIVTRPTKGRPRKAGMSLFGRLVLASAILTSLYSVVRIDGTLGSVASAADALAGAVYQDDSNAVKKLLDQGIDVNEVGKKSGETPLEVAAQHGRFGMVELLVERGAHPQIKARYGKTALHQASDPAIIALLLKSGADVNAVDEFGDTPLHGLEFREPATVKAFLSGGANINAQNHHGETPVVQLLKTQTKCEYGSGIQNMLPIVAALLSGNPDLSIADSQGNTALSLARQSRANCKDWDHEKKAAAQLIEMLQQHKPANSAASGA